MGLTQTPPVQALEGLQYPVQEELLAWLELHSHRLLERPLALAGAEVLMGALHHLDRQVEGLGAEQMYSRLVVLQVKSDLEELWQRH